MPLLIADFRTIAAVRHVAQQAHATGWKVHSPLTPRMRRMRYAELTANLDPATNFKTGATTANAKFLVADPDNVGDLKDGETFTVTNRWVDLELTSGKKLVVARIAGEWAIVASECPA